MAILSGGALVSASSYPKDSMYCTACGTVAKPKKIVKGSFILELLLWLCFLLPGIIYSVWRLSNKANACPKCGSESMIPIDSPKALQALKG
jgi:hypothetical protein